MQTQPLDAEETCIHLEHIPVGPPQPWFSPPWLSFCFDGSNNFCLLNPRGPVSGSKKGEDDEIVLLWLGLRVGETVVNLSRQHSGLYQYSVCEGPAPMLRARLDVHPAAPPKHPGLRIFFFFKQRFATTWGGREDGIGESMLRWGLLGPALSTPPCRTGCTHSRSLPGLKEAESPELWGPGFVLLQ